MDACTLGRRQVLGLLAAASLAPVRAAAAAPAAGTLQSWPLQAPARTGIHDVAPAPDGGVWFSAQRSGQIGIAIGIAVGGISHSLAQSANGNVGTLRQQHHALALRHQHLALAERPDACDGAEQGRFAGA